MSVNLNVLCNLRHASWSLGLCICKPVAESCRIGLTSAAHFRVVVLRLQCLMEERSIGPSQHPALCLSLILKQKPPSSCPLSASNPQSTLPICSPPSLSLLLFYCQDVSPPPPFCLLCSEEDLLLIRLRELCFLTDASKSAGPD